MTTMNDSTTINTMTVCTIMMTMSVSTTTTTITVSTYSGEILRQASTTWAASSLASSGLHFQATVWQGGEVHAEYRLSTDYIQTTV